MEHVVYILQSQKDQGIYIGKTNNIKRRLAEHAAGSVSSTKSRRPLILIRMIPCSSELEVRLLEKKLKKGYQREKIKQNLK